MVVVVVAVLPLGGVSLQAVDKVSDRFLIISKQTRMVRVSNTKGEEVPAGGEGGGGEGGRLAKEADQDGAWEGDRSCVRCGMSEAQRDELRVKTMAL